MNQTTATHRHQPRFLSTTTDPRGYDLGECVTCGERFDIDYYVAAEDCTYDDRRDITTGTRYVVQTWNAAAQDWDRGEPTTKR